MCALRATATLTTTTQRREREREKKYRRLRCNTNRKSSALSALFRVLRALEGVVVFLNIVSRRRRRRPIGFKRVTPFPHPNYLGSQNRCVFSPKIFPIFFSTKSARKKKSRHVLSSPPTRERFVFPRRVFRFLVFVAIIVAVAHHHHQSFLGGVFSRRLCVDTIR